ncbi:MAG: arsenate reductase (glutaredoxin) [Woeseiaceae bacterium]|nr:arsenate reductase (glutaredoxin) [Woeseiaceae bacterium]
MTITIYHNPRCSKSRKTLELIENAGISAEIVAYLDTPPDGPRVLELAKLLEIPVNGLLRRGEAEFREASDLPDLDDDAGLAAWLSHHPRVIERPIVVDTSNAANPRAVIGRPPENVLALLA